MQTEITTDTRTVWVNDMTGCCIGRFSRHGVDVHKTGAEQSESIHCEMSDITPDAGWLLFVASMRWHHGVDILPEHKPEFVDASPQDARL